MQFLKQLHLVSRIVYEKMSFMLVSLHVTMVPIGRHTA